ncbi:hypothetical protein FGU65_13305 [Methanoculleus sp. FWC-SCC1]|uniref:Uncharacterized protein n=1 Tax=Methanoculleus frigidifontis TaxID=2584085 RepID=A0ABT8MD14_9EURY|nr:hypothetical protein [Methanoculleus sp. FWC-SCC1]MDN7025845.1 hypothetical protein [Methanoculleus sp. FWC-SCC1]
MAKKEKRPDPEIPFEEKGTDTVYSPVPKDIDEPPIESNLPPEAPDMQTTRVEKTIAKHYQKRTGRKREKE